MKPVSVIIPTRNRLPSLRRTLEAIAGQTVAPCEIIVVDSSDIKILCEHLPAIENLKIIHSKASVCLQRNIGIEQAKGEYILLCDDDIEPDQNYLRALVEVLEKRPEFAIASGVILEKSGNSWSHCPELPSRLGIYYINAFKLSAWFDTRLSSGNSNAVSKIRAKGNHIAVSGWPVVTDYSRPMFTTPIYGLGAALFRSEALKKNGFDPAFFANGIGDNYDLALAIGSMIAVTWSTTAKHHKEASNRVSPSKSYYYRVSALHYIMLKYPRFKASNRFWLWTSVFGNGLLFLRNGEFRKLVYNSRLLLEIIAGRNLYRNLK